MSRVYFTDRDLGNQFPDILAAAGLMVERHASHFAHDCADHEWLQAIGKRGWVAITHNSRIRYTPNQLHAIVTHAVSLLVVVGHARYAELAHAFVATHSLIERFLDRHSPPLIAKVRRPDPHGASRRPSASGSVELWFPR